MQIDIVLKQVLAIPGCLSSVYSVLTNFNPCFTYSIGSTLAYGLVSTTAAAVSPPIFLPNLSSLSLLSCSSIYYFADKNSFFSLFYCSNAIHFCYSSIFLLASANSLTILILFFSASSYNLFSSSALFFLIYSCNSFAFLNFSSLVIVFFGPLSAFLYFDKLIEGNNLPYYFQLLIKVGIISVLINPFQSFIDTSALSHCHE